MHKHARVLVAIALYGNEAVQVKNCFPSNWMTPIFSNPINDEHMPWQIHPDYEDKVPTLAEIEALTRSKT